jgi:septal ring factor EnvC (AmiA/AmiB activator)
LKEAAKTLLYIRDQGIADYADLERKSSAASKDFHVINAKIRAAETRLAEITALQKQIANYHRTREIYKQYRLSGYSAKFLAAHDAEITIHKAAKKYFDSLNLKKLPSIAALKQEYAALLAEKKKLYSGYNAAKETMRQLTSAKANVDMVLEGPSTTVLRGQAR